VSLPAATDSISLVIVDLVMSGADGIETLTEMLELAPEKRILPVSGYTPEVDRVDALLRARPAPFGRIVQEAGTFATTPIPGAG
jgi:DNA-binding NarL/FixJ family response regulator